MPNADKMPTRAAAMRKAAAGSLCSGASEKLAAPPEFREPGVGVGTSVGKERTLVAAAV
jgi:hypothetical protein